MKDSQYSPAHRSAGRVLFLLTDAFGGHGGIAKFNRDFITAACRSVKEVVAYPRILPLGKCGDLPLKLRYETRGAGGKLQYAGRIIREVLFAGDWELIICGHIHLLPLAWLVSVVKRVPLILVIHGIEAWKPSQSWLANILAKRLRYVVAVSETSKDRFVGWTGIDPNKVSILPNCVDLSQFSPQGKDQELVERYRLRGKTVLMTLGRLASFDRYKGFDEVLDVLPLLLSDVQNAIYLIAGDGEDRTRLQRKAASLGIADRVVFTGLVSESEKSQLYSVADAFVMPSRGEGFGIVLLEAMACGIPVVASMLDGGREALLNGKLGVLVDPRSLPDVRRGILEALKRPKSVPDRLEQFSFQSYQGRVSEILSRALGSSSQCK